MAGFAIPMLADQIELKNGDRLTGTIVRSDGKVLVLKTEYAGDITIKFETIRALSSTGEMNITVGGTTTEGVLSSSGDNVVVASKATGNIEGPESSITMLRNPDEEAAYKKGLNPNWSNGWSGGLNVGFNVTAGNSETRNLNIAFNAARTGAFDKITLYENTVRDVTGKINREPISPAQDTANQNAGGMRYDFNFGPRVFAFASADFFANQLQDLDLRSILGGGIGFHAIKTKRTTLDLLAGLSYTHESYSGVSNPNPPATCIVGTEPSCFYSPSDSAASLNLGEAWTQKLAKNTVLTQSFLIYPALSATTIALPLDRSKSVHEYRFAFNLGTVTKINKWLGWENTFTDNFTSNPPSVAVGVPRIERNDLQLATGLNIAFSH
jgi:putative salt-induced outer membrane protein YdiY